MDIETLNKPSRLTPIIIGVGVLAIAFMIATMLGIFRVHIENLKTRTVWIFNAPSESSVSLSSEDIQCIRRKECELLEDGTIKLK